MLSCLALSPSSIGSMPRVFSSIIQQHHYHDDDNNTTTDDDDDDDNNKKMKIEDRGVLFLSSIVLIAEKEIKNKKSNSTHTHTHTHTHICIYNIYNYDDDGQY